MRRRTAVSIALRGNEFSRGGSKFIAAEEMALSDMSAG